MPASPNISTAGLPVTQARRVVIALHGRGGTARDMLALAAELDCPDCAYLAPQAEGGSWYPLPFLAPLEQNEPWLSRALAQADGLIRELEAAGIPSEQVALLGFSQGACLALETAARFPRRYAAVIAFSGGLIGPPGGLPPHPGSLAGTPVFLGCSDADSHIPKARVEESAQLLRGMGAAVDLRLYPGMGHTINAEELARAAELLQAE